MASMLGKLDEKALSPPGSPTESSPAGDAQEAADLAEALAASSGAAEASVDVTVREPQSSVRVPIAVPEGT